MKWIGGKKKERKKVVEGTDFAENIQQNGRERCETQFGDVFIYLL